jgi:hypothetical protein
MMAFALLESLAVTGFLALLSALLPARWLKDGFALKGFVSILVFTVTSIILQKFLDKFPSTFILMVAAAAPIAAIALLMFAVRSAPKFRNLLLNIEDRILIMLFVYVPIGLLSLFVVLYRNLL